MRVTKTRRRATGGHQVGYRDLGANSILPYIITHNPQPCQATPARVLLAHQAQQRADRAAALWDACKALGDLEAATYWRRRQLLAQAIYWSLTHPAPNLEALTP